MTGYFAAISIPADLIMVHGHLSGGTLVHNFNTCGGRTKSQIGDEDCAEFAGGPAELESHFQWTESPNLSPPQHDGGRALRSRGMH
jgi:hypothetical protein